ncbi:MAG: hypothetical protein D6806_12315 [Deltaproteobacteria bacterium]|nr:MAG: hypothetical protein D6806_12315 [Deltaproteobacteria bacterium]
MYSLPSLLIVVACLFLSSCEAEGGLRTFCSSDLDCPAGYRCQRETGLCVCATDEVCPPGYVCSADGICRKRIGCDTNLDCPEGTFCDSESGVCIEQGKCTSDKHCPPGQICTELYRCAPGCRDSDDCPLGQMCLDGSCLEGKCEDKSWCDYGQLCDTETHTCYDDDRGPYCAYCRSATIYEPHQCGDGPNFCLVKGGDLTLPPYCGVDCSQGQPCPNGYECYSVRIVYTRDNCRSDAECSSGRCYKKEGDELGFCLCSADEQCPQDSCDDTTMECRITRRPCTPGGNECDRPIYCIDGYCHIGYNCKPKEGLRCEDILSP